MATRKPTGEAFYRDREQREATRPTEDPAEHGTCDWGGCNDLATQWRHDKEHGWLPVCDKCSRTTWDTSSGRPMRRGRRTIDAAARSAEQGGRDG